MEVAYLGMLLGVVVAMAFSQSKTNDLLERIADALEGDDGE